MWIAHSVSKNCIFKNLSWDLDVGSWLKKHARKKRKKDKKTNDKNKKDKEGKWRFNPNKNIIVKSPTLRIRYVTDNVIICVRIYGLQIANQLRQISLFWRVLNVCLFYFRHTREVYNFLSLNFVNIQLLLNSLCKLDNPSDYGSESLTKLTCTSQLEVHF